MKPDEKNKGLRSVACFARLFDRCAQYCPDPAAKPMFEDMALRYRETMWSALKGDFAMAANRNDAVTAALEDVTAPMEDIYDKAQADRRVYALWRRVNKSIQYFGSTVVSGLSDIDSQPEEKIRPLRQLAMRPAI